MSEEELSEDEVIQTLEKGEEKIDELKQRQEELVKANQELVTLVKKLEDELEEEDGDKTIELEGYEYSYKEGWKSSETVRERGLEIKDNPEVENIRSQINQVVKTLKELDSFKAGET